MREHVLTRLQSLSECARSAYGIRPSSRSFLCLNPCDPFKEAMKAALVSLIHRYKPGGKRV